jgi:RNA polymerase, sigma-24 subunit, RpoE
LDAVKQLIKKTLNNDLAAFEELVSLYQSRVYSLGYKLSGNHDDAQDLAQEVFIRAFGALKDFRNEADFGTWLHRITVNLWLNMRRKQVKQVIVSVDEPVRIGEDEVYRELAAAEGNPEQMLENKEFSGLVRLALGELPREYRAVLVLREIEGYSYEEVAAILKCSLGTVKSRLNRARQILKQKVTVLAQEAGVTLPGKEK